MQQPKRFIIRKYVMARNIPEALRLDRKTAADEVWVDPEWLKLQDDNYKKVGFTEKRRNK